MSGTESEQNAVDLYRKADQIPSMGGRKLGVLLRRVASGAPKDASIVEVGCWLGSSTAQLALGIAERPDADGVHLHCYDRWRSTSSEVKKANQQGLRLAVGVDTLPLVRSTLEPFDIPITFHKGDVRQAEWDGGPISVYVDDASKSPKLFCQVLLTFGPSWVPGETVLVLMDYDMWKKTGRTAHLCQKQFVEANRHSFEPLPHDDRIVASVAVFRYSAPIDAIRTRSWRNLWKIWLQMRRKTGFWSMVAAGHWIDFFYLLRIHVRMMLRSRKSRA